MQKAFNNFLWKNLPSTDTALEADRLNTINNGLDTVDDRVVAFDTTKANQSDMLQAVKTISFDSQTGIFRFTFFNNTYIDIDTDIEKIAINFDYDDDPTSPHYQQLIIQLDDGTYKYVDLSALITQYEFTDSTQIHFEVNNGSVTATVINGSITEEKLQPNFLADCRAAKTAAELAETNAKASEDEANAWANGEIDGVPVPPTHPAYQNNAKYYKDLANPTSLMALTDTDINYPSDKQALVYDEASEKWKNQDVFITSEEQTTNDTFETLNGGKLDSCVVKLDPIQDLHGYDYPWVGGAGKNLLPLISIASVKANNTNGTWSDDVYTYKDITFELKFDADGNFIGVLINGTTTQDYTDFSLYQQFGASTSPFVSAGNYTISSNSNDIDVVSGYANTSLIRTTGTASGNCSNGLSWAFFRVAKNVTFTNFLVQPMIRDSSVSDATFEPYTNVASITPHTQAQVFREGKNIYPYDRDVIKSNNGGVWTDYSCALNGITFKLNEDGTIVATGTATSNVNFYIFSKSNVIEYAPQFHGKTFNGCPSGGSSSTYRVRCVLFKTSSSSSQYIDGIDDAGSGVTIPDNAEYNYVRIAIQILNGYQCPADGVTFKPMIRSADASADFVPYCGQLYTIQLGQNVYSAYVDFISGEMKIVGKYVELDGSNDENIVSLDSPKRYGIDIPNDSITMSSAPRQLNGFISNEFSEITDEQGRDGVVGFHLRNNGSHSILVCMGANAPATIADFRTWLSNHILQVVYELATPIIVQLTPTQITALLGINNISAPLTKQSIYEAKFQELSAFNAVIDDNNESTETTYSSSKIEEKFASADDVMPKTATDSFKTINGGLLDKLLVKFEPVQNLNGYSKPWAGGAGKNLLPLVVDTIKGANTETGSSWSGDEYTWKGVTYSIQKDNAGNVTGIKLTGANTSSSVSSLVIPFYWVENTDYIFNGCPSDGSSNSYRIDVYDETDTLVANIFDYGTGNTYTPSASGTGKLRIRIAGNYTFPTEGLMFYPMIRLASIANPTFEPYSNICPISGHTQVKSTINDSTYTTSLGGTYYGGEVEQVSGEGESNIGMLSENDYSGIWGTNARGLSYLNYSCGDVANPVVLSNMLETKASSEGWTSSTPCVAYTIAGSNRYIRIYCYEATIEEFKANYSGLQIAYSLATTTSLNLAGQNITSNAGANNVSAPLTGQSIDVDGIEYKELFPFDDVTALVDELQAEIDRVSYSNSVNCLVGDTTCTITDANIKTTSIIEPFSSNASGNTIVKKNLAVTTGQVVITFKALAEDTSFKVRITNL